MRKLLTGFGATLLALGGYIVMSPIVSPALAVDCSDNAVIRCGVSSITDLRSKYNNDTTPGTKTIFSYMGMTSATINSATYKTGYVTKTGNVVVGGKVVATNAISAGRQWMPNSTKHVTSGTTFYTRSTTDSFKSAQLSAIVFFDSQGRFIGAALHDCGNAIKATNTVDPPVYRCDSLTVTKISRDTYDFALKYTARDGAALKNYSISFGDGQSKTGLTTSSARHTYAKPGTYTVTATLSFNVNGAVKTHSCSTIVTVTPAPIYRCDSLTPTKIDRNTFDYVLTYSAQHGASLTGFDLNFGDGQTKTGLTTSPVRHAYTAPGTYQTVATLHFSVEGAVKSVTCQASVTVSPAPVPGVKIEKTVNKTEHQTVQVGATFTYELLVTNTGDVDLKNVKVTDTAPEGIEFISASPGAITGGKTYNYILPETLKVGASVQLVITAKLTTVMNGAITNKACVDANEVSGTPDDCDTAIIDTTIEVCDTTTDTIVTIKPEVFQTPRYTKDLTQCDKMTVCDTTTGQTVTLPKNELTPQHTTDMSKCVPAPQPVIELPRTGVANILGGSIGIGSIVGASYAYIVSRRTLR